MSKIQNHLIFFTLLGLAATLSGQESIEIKSATTCKKCHEDIYIQWSSSQHARSTPANNILFAKIYELSRKDTNGDTKLYCIRCHAPVSQINGDVDLVQEITNEGITCDICHSISELSDSPQHWPNIYEPGNIKRGPHGDTDPEGHESVYSELFENSRLCSGCHGDMLDIPGTRSCGNLTICDTDFEWKSSSYAADGKSCVDCHMTGISGQLIADKTETESQHNFYGAYSPGKLREAAKVDLNIKEFEGEIIASVQVENVGAAHLLPTGPPARMMILKVSALNNAGEVIWSNFTDNPAAQDPYGIFHIVFADPDGKVPSMPWLASRIVKDTRLRPGEKRQLVYKLPAEGVVMVEAKLLYRLAPPPLLDKFEITDSTLRNPYLMAQARKLVRTK
ncbi:MAG: hypothetical protein IIB44_04185 [Candidatus Marinimicrobia bacterium]|nr:hypothetical protein [Candidatus Neomarinimicrobiota bacterium]